MIRFFKNSDLELVIRLWVKVFGDSDSFVRFYMQYPSHAECMLVDDENGVITAMLSMLPIHLKIDDLSVPGRYIYAVATDPAFRGRGKARDLIEFCHSRMRDYDEPISVLVPSDASLFDYYSKLGFRTAFSVRHKTVLGDHIRNKTSPYQIDKLTPSDFLRIRNVFFRERKPFVAWDEDALSYLTSSMNAFEIGAFRMVGSNFEAYALCSGREQSVFISEMAHIGISAESCISIIHEHLRADRYTIRIGSASAQDPVDFENVPFGMIHYVKLPESDSRAASINAAIVSNRDNESSAPYLGLVLD